jgi:hypothetical protein
MKVETTAGSDSRLPGARSLITKREECPTGFLLPPVIRSAGETSLPRRGARQVRETRERIHPVVRDGRVLRKWQ